MRYLALACDYDGTIATDGRAALETLQAIERLNASGRVTLLVTGRQLDDLLRVCPQLDLFARVVAENGAVLYHPAAREASLLCEPPPTVLLEALRMRGVPLTYGGRAVVETHRPHDAAALEVIRDLGLDYHIAFNRDSVMLLPSGVNKAGGLLAALAQLGLSPHNVAAVGDAENDHALLAPCECGAAVANAVPMLRERADVALERANGRGVIELIEALLADDLQRAEERLTRHHVVLGACDDGTEVRVRPYGSPILLAGRSGSGKSTLATAFLERLMASGYQCCVIDPEGDYEAFPGLVTFGSRHQPPILDDVLKLLEHPADHASVNLLGIPLPDRPALFHTLFARLSALRARTGRPHWVLIDEAHHLVPAANPPTAIAPDQLTSTLLITVHPDQVARPALHAVGTVLVVGDTPASSLQLFVKQTGDALPRGVPERLEPGEAIAWTREAGAPPFQFRIVPSRIDRRRHQRKYAEGDLGPDRSFYFHGPNGRLNLRAQNLTLFLQLAHGVDPATWLYHLRRGDYSRWLRTVIKDPQLAEEAERLERAPELSARDSFERLRDAIEREYTLPAASAATGPSYP